MVGILSRAPTKVSGVEFTLENELVESKSWFSYEVFWQAYDGKYLHASLRFSGHFYVT